MYKLVYLGFNLTIKKTDFDKPINILSIHIFDKNNSDLTH